MFRLIGSFVSLLAVAAVVILLLMFVATGRSPVDPRWQSTSNGDGGVSKTRLGPSGELEEMLEYDSSGCLVRHRFMDSSMRSHLVTYESCGIDIVRHEISQ